KLFTTLALVNGPEHLRITVPDLKRESLKGLANIQHFKSIAFEGNFKSVDIKVLRSEYPKIRFERGNAASLMRQLEAYDRQSAYEKNKGERYKQEVAEKVQREEEARTTEQEKRKNAQQYPQSAPGKSAFPDFTQMVAKITVIGFDDRKFVLPPVLRIEKSLPGSITLKICVGNDGQIIETEFDWTASSNVLSSSDQQSLARDNVRLFIFEKSPIERQCGLIRYDFIKA
ncbi:MAG: hypothetical protein IT260_09820, partial [Saprospiraceae bacterium]|nr:hypothetical protein [Saprospiraceae bacterium]